MILTKHEIEQLSEGYYIEYEVKRHSVKRLIRHPQAVKNKTIYDFARRYLNQCERHGVSAADVRHVKNLIDLLKIHVRR
jgi:hypothetical protein